MSLDPRNTLARPDLAAAALEGVTPAARYAPTTRLRCAVPAAAIRRAADADAEQLDALLFGEDFDVLEAAGGWAWGQARRDGYVGYVERAALAAPAAAPTHRVAAVRAFAFTAPNLKSRPAALLPLGALVALSDAADGMARIDGVGWMFARQLASIGRFEADFVAVAERFLQTPYLWGGRGPEGIDCSGLVQQALLACGRACPRDSDQQRALGAPVRAEALRRGDLVFWPGHVAIMLDRLRILHANAHHMRVAIEPLAAAVARISAEPMACRRL